MIHKETNQTSIESVTTAAQIEGGLAAASMLTPEVATLRRLPLQLPDLEQGSMPFNPTRREVLKPDIRGLSPRTTSRTNLSAVRPNTRNREYRTPRPTED